MFAYLCHLTHSANQRSALDHVLERQDPSRLPLEFLKPTSFTQRKSIFFLEAKAARILLIIISSRKKPFKLTPASKGKFSFERPVIDFLNMLASRWPFPVLCPVDQPLLKVPCHSKVGFDRNSTAAVSVRK
jgi:hypothetical protein